MAGSPLNVGGLWVSPVGSVRALWPCGQGVHRTPALPPNLPPGVLPLDSLKGKKEDLPAPLTEEEVAEAPKEEPKPAKPKTPREERAVKFGAKLKALRQAHGLSRKELSDMIDYTDSSISAWETGVNIPSTAAMKLLKDVFVGEDLTY